MNYSLCYPFRLVSTFLIAGIILSMASCSERNPRAEGLVPVSGTITLDGAPLGQAMISLHRLDDRPIQGGSAVSDANGSFAINMFAKGDGTFPGDYQVTVIKELMTYPISDEEILRREREGLDLPSGTIQSLIPERYRSPETSGLTLTVPPRGIRTVTLELQSSD